MSPPYPDSPREVPRDTVFLVPCVYRRTVTASQSEDHLKTTTKGFETRTALSASRSSLFQCTGLLPSFSILTPPPPPLPFFLFQGENTPFSTCPFHIPPINAAKEKIKTHTLVSHERQLLHAKEGAAHLCHTSVAALGLVITASTDKEYTLVPNFKSRG